MLNWILLLAALYIVSGILAYGFTLAYFQREWPGLASNQSTADNKLSAMFFALFGLFGLFGVVVAGSTKHGLMFRTGGKK